MKKILEVKKFSKGVEVFQQTLGVVLVDEFNRMSARVWNKYWHKVVSEMSCGSQQRLALYVDGIEVKNPHPFSSYATVSKN